MLDENKIFTWQDFLTILVLKSKDVGIFKSYLAASGDYDKFRVCYSFTRPYLQEWLSGKAEVEIKSPSKSVKLRELGNEMFIRGNDKEALKLYNSSVVAAPYRTAEFALALSNRSATLRRLNYFEESIKDIDLALMNDSIEIPRTKLLIRKVLLLHELGLYKDTIQLAKSIFPDDDFIRKHSNSELKTAYFDALEKEQNAAENISKEGRDRLILPVPKGGFHDSFPSASSHVSLRKSKEKGRYVVATEELDKSDIIFVEKPFALVVLPDEYLNHCHHCCKAMVSFLPCEECTRAYFCGEECRDAAWSTYHRWECRGLALCHSVGIAHLGLRLALLADDSPRYHQVVQLQTHLQDMKSDDTYQYTITAALLTLYLELYTSYFKHNPSVSVNEMGRRVLCHIAQLICNGHAITKVDSTLPEMGCTATSSEKQIRIATAIYPSASMMNHSCDQNIANSFLNEYLIVRATRKIHANEEVFNCYGPNYKTMKREDRLSVLESQYLFTCTCRHCTKPDESRHQVSALLCYDCSGPVMEGQSCCADCRKTQPLLELVNLALTAQDAFNQGQELLSKKKVEEAKILVEKSVQLSSQCLYKFNSDLRTYKDSLARMYAESGQYKESINLIEDNVKSIEKQFGSVSVEMCRELIKLFDVLELDLKTTGLLKNSPIYREKSHKMEIIFKKVQEITDQNVEAKSLDELSRMSDIMSMLSP